VICDSSQSCREYISDPLVRTSHAHTLAALAFLSSTQQMDAVRAIDSALMSLPNEPYANLYKVFQLCPINRSYPS
jgi:hypothetical protein